jgi:hypothetical protein
VSCGVGSFGAETWSRNMLPSTCLHRTLPVLGRSKPGRDPIAASAAAPETAFDRTEAERLKNTDAFAELVRINGKQSVNRPQKVRMLLWLLSTLHEKARHFRNTRPAHDDSLDPSMRQRIATA